MNLRICVLVLSLLAPIAWGQQESASAEQIKQLVKHLRESYGNWREAMVARDARRWRMWTAEHRQMEVRNRLVSEKRPFPGGVFELPAPPPEITDLACLYLSKKGKTAKASFFGKVNFGVGGDPTDNLLVLSYVRGRDRWLYDRADFVNLSALPEVRRELAERKLDYFKETPEVKASGEVPETPRAVPAAKYIAKVYVFCPGREVKVNVNGMSRHRFANNKAAEVVLGGAQDGRNEVKFTTEALEGSTGREALAVRVYLMSEITGTKPIKAYEFLANEGDPVPAEKEGTFEVDRETARKLVP